MAVNYTVSCESKEEKEELKRLLRISSVLYNKTISKFIIEAVEFYDEHKENKVNL